jgi:ATP-dependent protease HslVU (ClpYQ) peptidase subunit
MTCVVAVVDGERGKVVMGADSAAVEENLIVSHVPPKVFKIDEFGIGYCHSFRLGQVIQHFFQPPELPDENLDEDGMMSYMVRKFVPELRIILDANDYPSSDEEKASWSLLVGVRSSIYIIESDFHVGYYEDHFAAIGAGYEYALGAMLNSRRYGEDMAREGLAAAKYFCPYVTGPFNFIEV